MVQVWFQPVQQQNPGSQTTPTPNNVDCKGCPAYTSILDQAIFETFYGSAIMSPLSRNVQVK